MREIRTTNCSWCGVMISKDWPHDDNLWVIGDSIYCNSCYHSLPDSDKRQYQAEEKVRQDKRMKEREDSLKQLPKKESNIGETIMRDGYQPDKSFMDDRDIPPTPPHGGSEVGNTPELKCIPNYAPQKIYLQFYGEDNPETLTQKEMACIPFDEISWCAKRVTEFDQEYIRADLYDDPLSDSTDFAHPAWWRAEEFSYRMMCERINEFLDGEGYAGTSHTELELIKHRIRALREKPPAAFTIQCMLVFGAVLGMALTYFYPF